MNRVLIVGQTPPPWSGQAVMIDYLVKAEFSKVIKFHLRMNFSKSMEDIGNISLRKILYQFIFIIKIYYYRFKYKTNILYFPPSGPTKSVYRDIFILLLSRFLFKKTIFHFHASGLSENYKKMNIFMRFLFRKAFFYPDLCIHLSKSCPEEGVLINSFKNITIHNGIPDIQYQTPDNKKEPHIFTILFVGLLNEYKGELDLIRAGKILKENDIIFKIQIAGQFNNTKYKEVFFNTINSLNLTDEVEYIGLIRDQIKHNYFCNADVFCFPSFFNSESFPLVLIEAMKYGLPIISTKWRGIPDMIIQNENGILIDIHNPSDIANSIMELYSNPNKRNIMGKKSREIYENQYTINKHLKNIEDVFFLL